MTLGPSDGRAVRDIRNRERWEVQNDQQMHFEPHQKAESGTITFYFTNFPTGYGVSYRSGGRWWMFTSLGRKTSKGKFLALLGLRISCTHRSSREDWTRYGLALTNSRPTCTRFRRESEGQGIQRVGDKVQPHEPSKYYMHHIRKVAKSKSFSDVIRGNEGPKQGNENSKQGKVKKKVRRRKRYHRGRFGEDFIMMQKRKTRCGSITVSLVMYTVQMQCIFSRID